MSRQALLALLLVLAPAGSAAAQADLDGAARQARYAEDFDVFWRFADDRYAYFDQKQTDWERVRDLYGPEAAAATDDRAFLGVLERAVGELYDAHAGFGVHNSASPRLVPSGTDLWAEWRDGAAVVTDVRAGSAAEAAGVRVGMTVRFVDGLSVGDATRQRMPRTLRAPDPAARDWALRAALAGTHAGPVHLVLDDRGIRREVSFTPGVARPEALLHAEVLGDGLGYVRIHDALGDPRLIAAFDTALVALRGTRGLVLDLRDTPSGGTTTVARGLLSRLVEGEHPYQRHELVAEARATGVRRVWLELVTPRGPFAYTAPVAVLVGRWTGSMGEGLAIGLDGIGGRATVIGTRMAGLLGAVSERTLPNTGIVARLPTERLAHVNGTPRESFVPPVSVLPPGRPGVDAVLERGLRVLDGAARVGTQGGPLR